MGSANQKSTDHLRSCDTLEEFIAKKCINGFGCQQVFVANTFRRDICLIPDSHERFPYKRPWSSHRTSDGHEPGHLGASREPVERLDSCCHLSIVNACDLEPRLDWMVVRDLRRNRRDMDLAQSASVPTASIGRQLDVTGRAGGANLVAPAGRTGEPPPTRHSIHHHDRIRRRIGLVDRCDHAESNRDAHWHGGIDAGQTLVHRPNGLAATRSGSFRTEFKLIATSFQQHSNIAREPFIHRRLSNRT